MHFTKSVLAVALSAAVPAMADYAVNTYWGQTGEGDTLGQYCESSSIDYVTLAFVNNSPENGGVTDYPGTNFAAHCASSVYVVDGQESKLLSGCSFIQEDIYKCHQLGKKILLSIGGEMNAISNYTVSTDDAGEYFASFLFAAFGPYIPGYEGPRPFDISETNRTAIDGFDFDIEVKFDNQQPYIHMINTLRTLINAYAPDMVLTAAPQCPLDTANFQMKDILEGAQLDKIWIQFYNNDGCDATNPATFNYAAWETYLQGTINSGAELFVGLPATAGSRGYISPADAKTMICKYRKSTMFKGIMLWDANNAALNIEDGQNYYESIHSALNGCCPGETCSSTTSSSVVSTTTSSSSSSTSSTVSTTSTSSSATSTSTSTSSSATSTSSTTSSTSSYPVSTITSTSSTTTSTSSTTTSTSSYPVSTITSTSSSQASTSSYAVRTKTHSSKSYPVHVRTSTSSSTITSVSSSSYSAAPTSSESDYCSDDETSSSYIVKTKTSTRSHGSATASNSYPAHSGGFTKSKTAVVSTTASESYPVHSGGFTKSKTAAVSTTSAPVYSVSSAGAITTSSAVKYTTSTVCDTITYTVTSCAPTVTNCPGKGAVVTETISRYTTVYAVTETEKTKPTITPVYPVGGSGSETEKTKPVGSATYPVGGSVSETSKVVAVASSTYPVGGAHASSETKATAVATYPAGGSGSYGSSSAVKVLTTLTTPVYPTGKSNSTISATGGIGAYPTKSIGATTAGAYPTSTTVVTAGSAKTFTFSFGGLLFAVVAVLVL